ncbi:HPP family protein [Anaeromyxobacter sp. Red801]|uniref:CBS domain-containing protein n=1 Tax=Anaeromyxobacter sp. Red801 TaxID=3411632 RepID=UPI003BA02710
MASARERLHSVAVDAVMTRSPVTLELDATLSDAAEALLEGGFRHLPVVTAEGRLAGMLSERDLRSRLGTDAASFLDATLEALQEPVSEAMTPDPIYVRAGAPLADVLPIFADEGVGAVPVLDAGDRVVGIVSYVDLLRALARRAVAGRGGAAAAHPRGLPSP